MEPMITRTAIRWGIALVLVLYAGDATAAERYAVHPKPSRDQRLAPELDLVRQCRCEFVGICRRGKSMYNVPSEQTQRVQSMSVAVKDDPTLVGIKGSRLLISYAARDQKPLKSTLQAAGLELVEDYERGSFLLVEPVGNVTAETVDALLTDNSVVYAAPDYSMSVAPVAVANVPAPQVAGSTPNDPLFSQLWGMQNIGATKVWPAFHESPNVIVAVIDTGVDYNHPDLKGNMWTRNGSHGFDFFDDDNDPMDEQNHGTHCAGTIAGAGNNGVGVVGVNWRTQIMALRFLGPDGSGATSDAVKCIDWAVANGAHILSNSWSGPDTSRELAEAITRAEQKGVLFVAAAGNTEGGHNNDTGPYYPAAHSNANIITVAAIDAQDAAGSFTHFGRKTVDIGAPGVGIVSTVRGNQYDKYDGTSMAAPHVAGAAALIWSKTFPAPAQDRSQMAIVRDLIYQNARPVPALKGLWGYTAPARVPGGVLDISFLINAPSNGNPSTIHPLPGRRALVEKRMRANPIWLR